MLLLNKTCLRRKYNIKLCKYYRVSKMIILLYLVAITCCSFGIADQCVPAAQAPVEGSGCCGDATYDIKKIPGYNAGLDEYPWMGLVEYRMLNKNETAVKCTAVLISGRYALSTAHCFSAGASAGTPVSLRLGEYDISNNGLDCVDEGGDLNCNAGSISIPIENVIKHPGFKKNHGSHGHDISLIKIKETAPYTDFIRPICLPTSDVTLDTSKPRLVLAGWGSNYQNRSLSNILHHVTLPLVDSATCTATYKNVSSFELGNGQMCAGGAGKGTCHGDAGAPLMYEENRVMKLAGISSFGPIRCGVTGIPDVYTKIFAYVDWIKENMVE